VSLGRSNPWILLEGFHPAIFNILVQWLVQDTIWPLIDHSLSSVSAATYNALDITFATLFDTSDDGDPTSATTARKFIQAYFMGQMMEARYFMDAILNTIIRHLHMRSPPLPHHVEQVYKRSWAGLHGLKKLLVDAFIWARGFNSNAMPRLSNYEPEFRADVTATLKNIQTRKHTLDSMNHNNPLNREFVDVEINFFTLESSLCNDNQGRLKCRYHVHTTNEVCWNLIVDDTPVTMPPQRPIGAHRR
jgi:hypothetical protein